jgi:hypothetical protein
MTKLGIGVGILATIFCFSVGAQTINVMVLDQAGAQVVLQAGARPQLPTVGHSWGRASWIRAERELMGSCA